jgi:phosphinothricin tripeptide acetyl hydrolase
MRAARDASVDVTLAEWTGMIHVWQWYFPVLSEARDAIDEIGRFLRARLESAPGRKVG